MDYHFDYNAKTLYNPGTTQARDKHNSHKHTAKPKRRLPRVPSFGKTIRFVHDRIECQIPIKNPQTQPCQKYLLERPLHTKTMVPFLVPVVIAPLATPRENPTTTRQACACWCLCHAKLCARDEQRNTSTIRSAAMQKRTKQNIILS